MKDGLSEADAGFDYVVVLESERHTGVSCGAGCGTAVAVFQTNGTVLKSFDITTLDDVIIVAAAWNTRGVYNDDGEISVWVNPISSAIGGGAAWNLLRFLIADCESSVWLNPMYPDVFGDRNCGSSISPSASC